MRVTLETDRGAILLNPFVERLCGNLLWGILESLHAPEEIRQAEFEMTQGHLRIRAGEREIPLVNPFAQRLVTELLQVLLRNLKGVEKISRATFRTEREEG